MYQHQTQTLICLDKNVKIVITVVPRKVMILTSMTQLLLLIFISANSLIELLLVKWKYHKVLKILSIT